MLTLTRKVGQAIIAGEVTIVVQSMPSGNRVRLGITAPASVRILREELLDKSCPENNKGR